MTILLLKGYNNYFNRIKKSEADITTYKTASTSYLEYANVNFDPRDGIATTLVVGSEVQKKDTVNDQGQVIGQEVLKFDDLGCPDYLICHDNQIIKSRWFVVESVKITQGQYKLALKRDVLIDYGYSIMNAPCFVEKGMILDTKDPLLLNPEGMAFNQIKQGETVLRDRTNAAWLVGYVKKDMNSSQTVTYTFPDDPSGVSDLDAKSWVECVTFRDLDGTETPALKVAALANLDASTIKFRTWYKGVGSDGGDLVRNIQSTFSLNGNLVKNDYISAHRDWQGLNSTALDLEAHDVGFWGVKHISYPEAEKLGKEIFDHTFHWGYVNEYFNNLVASTKYTVTQGNNLTNVEENLTIYDGQVFIYDNKVYKLKVGQGTEKSFDVYYTGEDNICNDYLSSLYYEFKPHFQLYRNQDNPTRKKVKITLTYRTYSIVAVQQPFGTAEYTLPAPSQRNSCTDAMYDMFAMPVSPSALGLRSADTDLIVVTPGAEWGDFADGTGIIDVDTISRYQLAIAEELATKFGAGTQAGYIYDLQLLPYCPFDFGEDALFVKTHGYGPYMNKNILLLEELNTKDYTIIYRHDLVEGQTVDVPVGVVFYPTSANFAVGIKYTEASTTVHEEWLAIEKPILKAQGTHDGLPQYAIGYEPELPYEVKYDSVWEVGPNSNNPEVDIELSDGLTNEECSYILAQISGGLNKPVVYLTSTEFPTPPSGQEYSYKFTGDFTIKVKAKWIMPDKAEDIKIKNECDFYRLTSPNYNSFYEFKKTKLAGGINDLRAVCTYKPFNPYIKINPDLNDSYYSIKDYNDNIGLMLSGDYSLPMMSDAMTNYELQNRNYQAIFNRQLTNLDVNQKIAKEQAQFQGITNMITAPIGGGVAGALAGAKAGPYGAIAGAVVGAVGGGILSGVGYAKDQEWLDRQQAENRDFAVDQFNYQLGNIEALPQSMTKSTPLSYNNKVWPILEYFSCTEKEKNVLRSKIKYNGMTVMAIGKLQDYMTEGGFVQGKLIRLNDLNDDSHISQAIYEEVAKGFYNGNYEDDFEQEENEGE